MRNTKFDGKEGYNLPTETEFKEVLDKINAARTAAGKKELSADDAKKQVVGNTGVAIGTTYTLTGEVSYEEIKDDAGKVSEFFPALVGIDGSGQRKVVSLAQIMGVSSLKGYTQTGTVENTVRPNGVDSSEVVDMPILCEKAENFNFEDDVWQPPTRNKWELYAFLVKHPDYFKDAKVTYVAFFGKKAVAKTPSKFAPWHAPKDVYAMTIKLWRVRFAQQYGELMFPTTI